MKFNHILKSKPLCIILCIPGSSGHKKSKALSDPSLEKPVSITFGQPFSSKFTGPITAIIPSTVDPRHNMKNARQFNEPTLYVLMNKLVLCLVRLPRS